MPTAKCAQGPPFPPRRLAHARPSDKKLLAFALCVPTFGHAGQITLGNLLRAEIDHMIRQDTEAFGPDVGQIVHQCNRLDVAKQPVIRMKVDTIYSSLVLIRVLDLSGAAEITLPEIEGRYRS